jgi:hypothetical protein
MRRLASLSTPLALAAALGACSGSPPGTPSSAGAPSAGVSGSLGGSSGGSAGLPARVPPRSQPGSCGLESPAFCENFETPKPGGNGGDIDETRWSFSRWGHETRQHFVRVPTSSEATTLHPSLFCGKPFSNILMHDDVVACDGIGIDGLTSRQLNEVYDDQGDFAINAMRARQLFDFTDRTGTIVFDVDAKINECNQGHGWWIELWVTEDPAPIPYHEAPGVLSYPRNGVGFNFQGLNSCPQGRGATQVSRVFVAKDYAILHDFPGWELTFDSDQARCFKVADQKLNHVKVLLSKDQAEIWASDYDDAQHPHRIAVAKNLDLPFTRGYVHLEHSAYNARKDYAPPCTTNDDVTGVQTYRWDNIGFDGPSYALPRAYEVDDNDEPDIDGVGGRLYGYYLTDHSWVTLHVRGLDLSGATSASMDFSFLGDQGRVLEYRFNGGATHEFTIPALFDTGGTPREGTRTFSNQVPLAELTNGDNTIEVMMSAPQKNKEEYIANVELTVQAEP